MATEKTSVDSRLPSQPSPEGGSEDEGLCETERANADTVTSYTGSTSEKSSTPPKYWTKRKVFTIVNFSFANFCVGALYALLGPFYPQEASKKGATSTEIGLVFGCFELIIIISTPFFGTYLTRIGAKFTYVAGLFVAGCCSVLFGFLDRSPPGGVFVGMCFAVRSVEALGTAAYITASMAIIANTFPDRASTMIGTLELFSGLGLMVAPPLGGFLYELGGFKLPFLSCGCLMGFVAFLSVILLPPQDMPDPGRKGSMWRLFRIPLVAIMVCFVAAGSVSIGFLDVALAIRLESIYNFSPLLIGVCFLVGPGLYTLFAPVLGIIADKISNGAVLAVIAVGYSINFVAFVLMGPAPFLHLPDDPLWLLLLSQALMGIGITTMVATFKIVNSAALEAGFGESLDTFGLVSGLFNTFFSMGALIGPVGGGLLIDVVGFEWAALGFGSFSGLMVLILLVYLLATRSGRQQGQELSSVTSMPPAPDESTRLLTDSTSST